MADHLYLVGDYEAAASIPIGATLARLEAEHALLPAAFYEVFTTNLYKWMRVYDYLDAQEHAETWMEDLSGDELEASVYRKVDMEIPACIKSHSKTLKYRRARTLLQEIQPHTSMARELIRRLLEMDTHGQGQEHAWPGQVSEKDVPGIDAWLMDAEYSRPGCLITWYENDAINACFDEEAQHMGENGPCQPNVALPIHLDKPVKELDEEVRRVFDHAGAMLRSLASAAKIVELIRDTSTMNISVNIGSSQDFRLSRALLVYGKSSYEGYPYRHPFVTLHDVIHDGDAAQNSVPSRTETSADSRSSAGQAGRQQVPEVADHRGEVGLGHLGRDHLRDDRRRPGPELVPVGHRHAEQLADHRDRQRERERGQQVDLLLSRHIVEQRRGDREVIRGRSRSTRRGR